MGGLLFNRRDWPGFQPSPTTDDELFATLEYLARKDYGGRLEIWQDGSIHLVREEPDAMHFDLPYSDDIPNN